MPDSLPTTQNLYPAWFQPMGFTLRILSNSPAIIKAAEVSFGRFEATQPIARPDFTFQLMEHDLDEEQLGEPTFRMEGQRVYQSTGPDSTLVINLDNYQAKGYFSATTLAHQAFFRWHFLELALFVMLEAKGLMGVHGSALVKNGRAILLRAASGGGKTTLAYAGARSRFQALAEDVVWLDSECNLWWGMPWSFHLLPDAKNLFPELSPYQPILQTNGEMKLEVNLETIRPNSTTSSAQPGSIVLIKRVPGKKSRLEPVDLATARSLWKTGRTGLEMKLPHHASHIECLFKQNIYQLYSGDDIEASLNLLETLFE